MGQGRRVPDEVLVQLLLAEPASTAVLILARQPADRARALLAALPRVHRERIGAVAGGARDKALEALRSQLLRELRAPERQPVAVMRAGPFDGTTFVAEVVAAMPVKDSERLLAEVASKRPALVARLRRAMVSFARLGELAVPALSVVLRQVPREQLLCALASAASDTKSRVLAGFSARARKRVLEDLSIMAAPRDEEARAAQRLIIELAVRLAEAGAIEWPALEQLIDGGDHSVSVDE